mmetsp:Transcript_31279/g.53007  ORF Transcript_31279/g.53007 Transcript_31279/m.53007 type:complete len:89 (-) Transcript_31279:4789-5055(-)
MKRLSIFDPSKQHKSIVLFISPQQLGDGTQWCNLLKHLAKEGIIAALCVDEAHAVVENHDSFRSSFSLLPCCPVPGAGGRGGQSLQYY